MKLDDVTYKWIPIKRSGVTYWMKSEDCLKARKKLGLKAQLDRIA